jgi:hypothetical protein
MDDIGMVLGVVVLFLVRVGLPVIALVALGLLVDRWQSKRERDIQQKYGKGK